MSWKKARIHEIVIKTLWVMAMIAITLSLFHRRKDSQEAVYITGIVVTLMWIVFFVCFSGLTSIGKDRVFGSPVSWWAMMALIVGAQLALLHLLVTTLCCGDLIGAGLAAVFLFGFIRFLLDAIKKRRKAAKKEASEGLPESASDSQPEPPQG